ncbi:MAG: hypothetical protein K6E51_06245 [Treponema sp.]|nr:hypothetical protein [Treponema sp.]
MVTNHWHTHFAVYKGIEFEADNDRDGNIFLSTRDAAIGIIFNFKKVGDIYIKEVSPYEVTKYCERYFLAKYKGKKVAIMWVNGDEVDIHPDPEDITYNQLKRLGFKQVEKGVYQKTLPPSELTDIHAEDDDSLKWTKQDYDECHKQ